MKRKEIIEKKLSILSPRSLTVIDESAAHAGHTGNPNNSGNSHFNIIISSEQLDGLSKIKQHRIINDLLEEEFANGLHALSIKILTKE